MKIKGYDRYKDLKRIKVVKKRSRTIRINVYDVVCPVCGKINHVEYSKSKRYMPKKDMCKHIIFTGENFYVIKKYLKNKERKNG